MLITSAMYILMTVTPVQGYAGFSTHGYFSDKASCEAVALRLHESTQARVMSLCVSTSKE